MQTTLISLFERRDQFYIDGHPVDNLFDDIYSRMREAAAANGTRLKFDVIAWEPLVVAADHSGINSVLNDLTMHAIDNTVNGNVTLRAFPTADNTAITFEVLDERPAPESQEQLQFWSEAVESARRLVHRMGGEFWMFAREEQGMKVLFTLPQWICEPQVVRYGEFVQAA